MCDPEGCQAGCGRRMGCTTIACYWSSAIAFIVSGIVLAAWSSNYLNYCTAIGTISSLKPTDYYSDDISRGFTVMCDVVLQTFDDGTYLTQYNSSVDVPATKCNAGFPRFSQKNLEYYVQDLIVDDSGKCQMQTVLFQYQINYRLCFRHGTIESYEDVYAYIVTAKVFLGILIASAIIFLFTLIYDHHQDIANCFRILCDEERDRLIDPSAPPYNE